MAHGKNLLGYYRWEREGEKNSAKAEPFDETITRSWPLFRPDLIQFEAEFGNSARFGKASLCHSPCRYCDSIKPHETPVQTLADPRMASFLTRRHLPFGWRRSSSKKTWPALEASFPLVLICTSPDNLFGISTSRLPQPSLPHSVSPHSMSSPQNSSGQ